MFSNLHNILLLSILLSALVGLSNQLTCTDECEEGCLQEPLKLTNGRNGTKRVCHYTVHDQCHPQPGFQRLLINQLLFHIPKDGICRKDGRKEGQGLLICFQGQLGKETPHLGHGQWTDIQYRLGNRRHNEVARRCDQLRNNTHNGCESEKCRELTAPPPKGNKMKQNSSWHGMLLWTDAQGDIVVQLSTSAENFTVRRSEFDEWLSLKLASPKHTVSFFSREIGPYRSFGVGKDGQERVERQNRIYLDNDQKLWEEYGKHSHKGAFLKNYAGIWTVGMDLLPTEAHDDDFWLFTERPDLECCELEAWFLTPIANIPTMPQQKRIEEFSQSDVMLHEGLTITLNGRIKKEAKKFEILCSEKNKGKNKKSRNGTFLFQWEDNFTKATLSMHYGKSGRKKKEIVIPSFLVPGHKFSINITCWKDHVQLNYSTNCNRNSAILELYKPVDFERQYNFKIHGDMILHEAPNLPSHVVSEYREMNFSLSEHQGFLVRGTIGQHNYKGFSLTFQYPHYYDNDTYALALELKVDLEEQKFVMMKEIPCDKMVACVGDGKNDCDCVAENEYNMLELYFFSDDENKIPIWTGAPESGGPFELFLRYTYNDSMEFEIWVNNEDLLQNRKVGTWKLDFEKPENGKFDFLYTVEGDINVEKPLVQPRMNSIGFDADTREFELGRKYPHTINLGMHPLVMTAKFLGNHIPVGWKESFGIFLRSSEEEETPENRFNAAIVGIADLDAHDYIQMTIHYKNCAERENEDQSCFWFIEIPLVLAKPGEDFTIRFVKSKEDESDWLQISINDWSTDVQIDIEISNLDQLYIASIAYDDDEENALENFPEEEIFDFSDGRLLILKIEKGSKVEEKM